MTTVRHKPTSNGRHVCPFPETGCTGRTCTRRSALPVSAVFAAVRQVSQRIASIPLAWCYTCDQYASDACARDSDHSLRKPPQGSTAPLHGDRDPLAGIVPSVTIPRDDGRLSRLLADAVKPSPTWSTEPPTADDLRATYERLRDAPPCYEPQPYVIHPRHYAQAKRDGCMCVLGMVPCPWHTAVKVGDPVTWIDRPLGGAETWPFDGWTVDRVRAPGGVPTSYDLAHTESDHRVIGATRDQFRVADPSRDPSPAPS